MDGFWNLSSGKSCLDNSLNNGGIVTISCVVPLVQHAIEIALSLAGTVALILILVASTKYITSGGGKAIDEAKNTLTYAIIGLIVVLLSFFIIMLISHFTGVGCIYRNFGFGGC